MDLSQVLTEIESRTKPYIGVMPQSTFSNRIRAIKAGNCNLSTLNDFMQKFGYVKKVELWEKK